jgi:DNA-directed RNA polymerase I subunit RPA1
MRIYGIEACRQSIVKEISTVFGHYNISVDYRHLSLIADYMTFQGNYRSFNRIGMELASSPLLKVSFETSMIYLMNSCITKESDFGDSSSSRIVLGLPPKNGTGAFDLVQDIVKANE